MMNLWHFQPNLMMNLGDCFPNLLFWPYSLKIFQSIQILSFLNKGFFSFPLLSVFLFILHTVTHYHRKLENMSYFSVEEGCKLQHNCLRIFTESNCILLNGVVLSSLENSNCCDSAVFNCYRAVQLKTSFKSDCISRKTSSF